jgi:hypothetical protein
MAAEMYALSFMLEIIRMDDWEWVACMSRFTTMIERQHSTHSGAGTTLLCLEGRRERHRLPCSQVDDRLRTLASSGVPRVRKSR